MTAVAHTTPENLPHYTLADLADLSVAEATAVYRAGRLPASMRALDGAPRGRMLAVARLDAGPAFEALRRLSAAPGFPWAGKSFAADDDDAGTGINRVRLLGTRELFPFDTRIEPSAIDGEPCIMLDYDKPQNPWPIRQIRDELREVSPGLFLGPAMWKAGGDPRLVLWFAIDATGQR